MWTKAFTHYPYSRIENELGIHSENHPNPQCSHLPPSVNSITLSSPSHRNDNSREGQTEPTTSPGAVSLGQNPSSYLFHRSLSFSILKVWKLSKRKTFAKVKKTEAQGPFLTFSPMTFWPLTSQMLCSVRRPFLAAELSLTMDVIFPFLKIKPTCPVLSLCMVIVRSKGLQTWIQLRNLKSRWTF